MSLTRQAAKRDSNERPIIDALKAAGATVYQISENDLWDLIVGFRGDTYLVEVKQPGKGLRPGQEETFKTWSGGLIAIIHSVPEALQFVGAIEMGSYLDE